MSTSAASHIPILSIPKFKSFDTCDPALVDVLEPETGSVHEPSEEDKLLAEYQRGVADGDARTRAHYEAVLEKERETQAGLLDEERARFDTREAANVSASIEGFFDVMEQRISYSLAKLLQSFLMEKVTEQLVAAFADNLRQLALEGSEKLIRLRGPQNLIDQVVEQLPTLRDRLEVEVADQLEMVALLDETTIETRLEQWHSQLADLRQEVA